MASFNFSFFLLLLIAGPWLVYLIISRLLPKATAVRVLQLAAFAGICLGIFVAAYPFTQPPVDVGGMGIILLIPIGAVFGLNCLFILWRVSKL